MDYPFQAVRHIKINVWIDRKIFYQQRIVYLFGVEALTEVMNSPDPIILPILNYHLGFDVSIIILI